MNNLFQEIRYALRALAATPTTTLAAIACIGLGIGATTTIFSAVNAILLRPFPFAHPEAIVAVHTLQPANEIEKGALSYPVYHQLVEDDGPFSAVAAFTGRSLTFTGKGDPERVLGLEVSATLFPLLGVNPVLGRHFRPDEDRPGGPGAVLLSHSLWMRRFDGDPKIVGSSILVNNRPSTIIGVMPPNFEFSEQNLAWVPLAPDHHDDPRSERTLGVFARLAPGVTADQANGRIAALGKRLATEHPEEKGWDMGVLTLRREMVGKGTKTMVLTLFGMVLFVLLIACANVANLFLARVSSQSRDLAVRAALGAGRGRLVRQVLLEALLVGIAGGLLGIVLANLGVHWMLISIPPEHALPYWMQFSIDGSVLAFTAAAAMASAVLFGLVPAFQATARPLVATIKERGRTEAGRRSRLRGGLVVFELALALVLLIGAALMIRSFLAVIRSDTGFSLDRAMTFRIYLPGEAYAEPEPRNQRIHEIVRRLEEIPGVEAAAASNLIPLGGGGSGGAIEIEGHPAESGQEPRIFWAGVTAHFFAASGVSIETGRTFTEAESLGKAPIAVVNRAFARKYFDGGDPVGRRFRLLEEEGKPWITIAGTTADLPFDGLPNHEDSIEPQAYLPYPWFTRFNNGFTVRTAGPPESIVAAARKAVRAADPGLPIFEERSLRTVWRSAIWESKFFSGMFSVFSSLALALAGIGVYGLLSHLVGLRRREIGLRVALGARREQVLGLVVGQGARLALFGALIGLPAAFGLTRVLSTFLYGVDPFDPPSFASITALLGVVALFASYLPASRATRVDPIEALRSE